MDVKYRDKSLICIEDTLLGKFKEKCDLIGINYKINNSNLQLFPALSDKTFVLYLLDKTEIIKQFAGKIKKQLIYNNAICIYCNNLNNIKYTNFLDADLILCFAYDSNCPDNVDMKFFTSLRNKDTFFASNFIKKLTIKNPEFIYLFAPCKDYLFKPKYWSVLKSKNKPVFLIEFKNLDFIEKNSDKLVDLISSSIIEKFQKPAANLEFKITADLIKEIYTEIKPDKQLENTKVSETEKIKLKDNKKLIKKNKPLKLKKRISNKSSSYPFTIPDDSPVYTFNSKNYCQYPISTFHKQSTKNNIKNDKKFENTLENFKNMDTDCD
jgi:hypothetical protein